MSKEVIESLSSRLQQSRQELLFSQQSLSSVQVQLPPAQASSQQAEQELSQALAVQADLSSQLEAQSSVFSALTHLFGQYRASKGIKENPNVVITKIMSPEEIASSDILKEACKSKYKEGFDLALGKIKNLDFQDNEGRTILMHAIINGFHYGVEKLLQRGADVNLMDNSGMNALIYSAMLPHVKYMKLIATKTTDVNVKVESLGENSALHLLISNTRKIMFSSEINGELRDAVRKFDKLEQLVVDEPISGLSLSPSVGLVVVEASLSLDSVSAEVVIAGRPINYEKILFITESLVARGADINAQNAQGHTPFFLACAHKLTDLAHELLNKYEIRFSSIDKAGYNALHWALETRDITLVEKVIVKGQGKGLDIDQTDAEGRTALFWATTYLLPDVVGLLVNKYGAKDIPNKQGATAWDLAIMNSKQELMQELIDIFAPKKELSIEAVKLWTAASEGASSIIEEQVRKGISLDVTIESFDGTTPLIRAVLGGHLSAAKILVDSGANVNKADKAGGSPLLYCLGGVGRPACPDIAKILIAKGADINQPVPGPTGLTPFFIACDRNLTDLAHELLEDKYKINFSLRDGSGWNALFWAVKSKDVSLVEKVIIMGRDKGVNVNEPDSGGSTALFFAAKEQLPNVVSLLLDKYNAKDIPNKYGHTAWDVATFNSLQALIDVFVPKKEIDPKAVKLWTAARNGDAALVEGQIRDGAAPDATIGNRGETTPLIQAIAGSHLPATKTIVENGADINKPDASGASPLYYSLGYAGQPIQPTIVKFLISAGANVNQPMSDGDTPLHMASYGACVGAIKLLLDRGAKVDSVNEKGKTSLHALIEKKDLEPVQKLMAVKYLLSKAASPVLKNGEGHDAIYLAKNNFPEASPWVEHSETLPEIEEFESSILGATQDFIM